MISLDYDNVDGFVRKHQKRGINVRSEGWDIVFFKPDKRAYRQVKGRYDRTTGEWGFETRVSPNSKGNWMVSPSLTRGNQSARA